MALMGMGDLLKRTKVIFLEVAFKPVYLGQPLFKEIQEFLHANGFQLKKLYPDDWFGDALYVRH